MSRWSSSSNSPSQMRVRRVGTSRTIRRLIRHPRCRCRVCRFGRLRLRSWGFTVRSSTLPRYRRSGRCPLDEIGLTHELQQALTGPAVDDCATPRLIPSRRNDRQGAHRSTRGTSGHRRVQCQGAPGPNDEPKEHSHRATHVSGVAQRMPAEARRHGADYGCDRASPSGRRMRRSQHPILFLRGSDRGLKMNVTCGTTNSKADSSSGLDGTGESGLPSVCRMRSMVHCNGRPSKDQFGQVRSEGFEAQPSDRNDAGALPPGHTIPEASRSLRAYSA